MNAADDCIGVQSISCTLSSDKNSVQSDSVDDGAKESQDIKVQEGYCHLTGYQSDSEFFRISIQSKHIFSIVMQVPQPLVVNYCKLWKAMNG